MKNEQLIVIGSKGRNFDFRKIIRYVVDKLSKYDAVVLSSPVEDIANFKMVCSFLSTYFDCTVNKPYTGHILVEGNRVPIIRCLVLANNLNFEQIFSPRDITEEETI